MAISLYPYPVPSFCQPILFTPPPIFFPRALSSSPAFACPAFLHSSPPPFPPRISSRQPSMPPASATLKQIVRPLVSTFLGLMRKRGASLLSLTCEALAQPLPGQSSLLSFPRPFSLPKMAMNRLISSSSSSDFESRPLLPQQEAFPQQQLPAGHKLRAFRASSTVRAAFWLTLSLVSLLLSAALLLLLVHPPPPHPPSSPLPPPPSHGSSSSINALPPDDPSQLHFHAQIMPASILGTDPVELLISGPTPDPSQKSGLPLASNPAVFNETGWSSYRPQLYFGLKNRRPDSPVFGLMWYRQKSARVPEQLPLRNWAMHEDDVVFMWNQHDGRGFGSQKITDGQLEMRTDFSSFGASSWMARLYLQRPEWTRQEALVLYFALQDKVSTLDVAERPQPGPGEEVHVLDGQSSAVHGNFSLKLRPVSGTGFNLSELLLHGEPFVDMAHVGELVKSALKVQPDGNFAFEPRPSERNPNFVALQVSVKEDTVLELLFKAQADQPAPPFLDAFRAKEEAFRTNFSRAFPIPKNFSALYHKMGHAALSNLLGGIGAWHGNCWMRSRQFAPPDSTKPYGPLSLLSAVPSRTGFPRGFIWDEGFHNLLIHKFDPLLSLQILGAYLDMMNVDGWIPREIAISSEAEARIPGTFLAQEDWVANPPMFFYLLRDFISDGQIAKQFAAELRRMYPRLKQLYFWLRNSQAGPKLATFRWHDRNQTTNLELNPATLSSGFDDFPRATHPTSEEYHLDLRCWMAMCSSVLLELAQVAGDEAFLPAIRKESALLNDIDSLDRLHWSEGAQRYCDYGLHSEAVELVPEKTPQGDTILVRKVLKEPKLGFVENVNGYANLFPLLMRLLPADSPKLGPMLDQIADPQHFWTPFGLRSISTLSPYYDAWNSRESSPYWRGPIWINMNYFAVAALKHYSSVEGPHRETCARLHAKLRDNLLANLAKEYEKTGFLWEHYNDQDGSGAGNHPFTGWTTLILKIMAGSY